MLYRVAFGTGFRVKELRSLEACSFDLDGDPPTVAVNAAYSKRRRLDVQPIHPRLAQLLRPWLADLEPQERPFRRMPRSVARTLRLDLEAARAAWIKEAESDAEREGRKRSDFLRPKDASGRVVDFHATRQTFISAIVAGGRSVKTAQELARHSTPMLTIGRYAHTRLHDLTGSVGGAAGHDTPLQTIKIGRIPEGDRHRRRAVLMPANRQQLPANRQQLGGSTGRNMARHRQLYQSLPGC